MRSEHFKIHELVPKAMFDTIHEDVLWGTIDNRLISSIDAIKKKFPKGAMTINNYFWGGDRGWSGLRTTESPWYSPTSQHTLGKAIDAVFSQYDVEEVRSYILSNPSEFPYIKGVEADVSWLHIDVRDRADVLVFTA